MTTVDLLLWDTADGGGARREVPWTAGACHRLPRQVPAASRALDDILSGRTAEWLLFWDPTLGGPDESAVASLTEERADVLHAGLHLGMAGLPEEQDYIQPTWWFAVDPPADRQALSWRVSLRACLVRTDVIRSLGHLDPAYATLEGAALDFGWRCLARGAIVVHEPALVGPATTTQSAVELPVPDRYLFLVRHHPAKWARYAMWRRSLGGRLGRERRDFAEARRRAAATPPPGAPPRIYARPLPALRAPEDRRVSVILPTLGRYPLVTEVLRDLTAQTVVPHEVFCIDQNDLTDRDPSAYQPFEALALEVIYQDAKGQWLARNAAIAKATGDLLLFLDDDSRIAPDFIERHLQALDSYRADISAGASLSVVGAPVPDNYAFFRAADQFDSGNALVRREVLAGVGAFDGQYDRMRGGDSDFGTRVYLAGGISVHNPLASRVHLKAASGGLRSFGSWDSYRQAGRLTPRPLPSVVYYSLRHFSPRQTREGLLIGLAQSVIPYALKRTASRRQWARYVAGEALLLPLSVIRVGRSLRAARRMFAQGPRIPEVSATVAPAPSSVPAGSP